MKNKKTVFYFVFDGMADWEASYALTGINKSGQFQIKTMALDKNSKRALSGIEILPAIDFIPEVDLKDIDHSTTAMLILPGGTAWQEGENLGIVDLVLHCIQQQITVAAIGDATVFLTDLQALNATNPKSPVKDRNIITANRAASIEFAKDIFEMLEIEHAPFHSRLTTSFVSFS